MKVKVRYHDILYRTDRATLFLISDREVWLPKKSYRFGEGRTIILSAQLATSKELRFDLLLHVPPEIKPVYAQEPIDELRYDPDRRY